MKPIDFSRETYATLKPRLKADLHRVYRAWSEHGPGTTREVSTRSNIDILTFRPRTTDLFQLGLVRIVEDGETIQREIQIQSSTSFPSFPSVKTTIASWEHHQHGTEGTYIARTMTQWQQWLTQQRAHANRPDARQLQMI